MPTAATASVSPKPGFPAVSVLLVDDCTLHRDGLCRVLGDADGIELSGVADTLDAALQLARELQPQVVVMDINPPYTSFLKGPQQFQRQCPGVKILALVSATELLIPRCFNRATLAGYVTKRRSAEELTIAIQSVSAGERYISNDLAQSLASRHLGADQGELFDELSQRELQVMLLVTQGQDSEKIAATLNLTPKTINGYRHRLLGKLGVRTEVELMRLALQSGIIGLSPGH